MKTNVNLGAAGPSRTQGPTKPSLSQRFRQADRRFSKLLASVAHHTAPQQIVSAVSKVRNAIAHQDQEEGEETIQDILAALAIQGRCEGECECEARDCPEPHRVSRDANVVDAVLSENGHDHRAVVNPNAADEIRTVSIPDPQSVPAPAPGPEADTESESESTSDDPS